MSSRRIRYVLALALGLLLALGTVPAGAAPKAPAPPVTYYLSLGDSVAAGWQPNPDTGVASITSEGYTDQLYRRLRDAVPGLVHQKMACPGETTLSMINGGGPHAALCGYPLGNSQLMQAVAFILSHPGKVAFITIDIGVNDVLSCLSAPNVPGCVAGVLPSVGTRLGQILYTLRVTAGYTGPIVGMNYYNPYLAAWIEGVPPDGDAGPQFAELTNTLAMALNNLALKPAYAAFGVPVADVFTAFRSTRWQMVDGWPFNVFRICQFTWMCSDLDIHPNRRGHGVIAGVFQRILEGYGIG